MKSKSAGGRHPLLFYRRTMSRLWKATLLLGILLAAALGFLSLEPTVILGLDGTSWLVIATVVALAISLFAFFARWMAYVQAQANSLKIVTPFLRFHISYKRMRSIRPSLTQQLFPPEKSSWSERSYLTPFYGKTALVVEMKGFPINPALLKLFLPDVMFTRNTTGMVLMVADWMQLSTEIDSFRGTWMQAESLARLKQRK
jgi:hypothetical protein